ncbi:peptidylprolyl isomerase [Gemmata sp.]|uniref:peptidylprolyl isomerase n=1 Tax=Gemmata sp. TaxID=1914242 RepID=UPI003F6FC96E
MRKISRAAAALVLGSSLAATAAAQAPAQPQPQPAPAAPQAQPQPPAPVVPAVTPAPAKPEVRPTGTAATVNGQAIPEVAVYRALRSFPEAHRETARKEIMSHLIENVLIDQYLNAIKVTLEDKEIEALINELKAELAAAKPPKDYSKELEAMMLTEAEFRTEVTAQLKWEKFIKTQGTDAALKQLFDSSPDVFDGTMVRARHILMTPGADEAKQKDAAQKLRGIKQVIDQEAAKAVAALPATADALAKEQTRVGKVEELFSAYAKEYSACPSKKDGGDLNFFPRSGAMVEPFAKAAFALKPFEMTDVVSTEFGYHLILVTARKQGTAKKFDDVKEDVRMLYAMRLREAVVDQMKPKAQITMSTPPAAAPPAPKQ